MTNQRDIYFCRHCRQVVEVVHKGATTLTCCGEPMALLEGNTTDAAVEKHIPVINDLGNSIEVCIGSVEHPMTAEHYIAFIEVLTSDSVYRKDLSPTDKPVASFPVKISEVISVREFCNLHGLWKLNP